MGASREAEALELELASGLTLRGLRWLPEAGREKGKILALHGWLDNAASFGGLGPLLAEAGYEVAAVEMAGHGWSDHRSKGARYHFIDGPLEVVQALDVLGWERALVVGHSMGAGIAALFAGLAPQRIERLVMLDGLGPFTTEPEDALETARQALEEARTPVRAAPFYPDLDALAERRAQAFGATMKAESARSLVERGSVHTAAGWQQRHDPALRRTSVLRLTEAHVRALFGAVECRVLLVRARGGWPAPEGLLEQRLTYFTRTKPTLLWADGGHHLHLDAPESLIGALLEFLDAA
jgi:pimeloyl-ACP methyl ester carboxylesterase